jgi:signal transduction histidine kinase
VTGNPEGPPAKIVRLDSRRKGRPASAAADLPAAPSEPLPEAKAAVAPVPVPVPVQLSARASRDRSVETVFSEGNRYLRQGNFEQAAQRYRRALQLGGELAEAFNNLAVACHRQRFLAEARRAIERALQLAPDNALYNHNAGLIARDAEEPLKALAYFDEALKWAPRSAAILQSRGQLLYSLLRYHKALADLAAAMELDPALPGLACQLALAATGAGETARARELLTRLAHSEPADPEPLFNLGVIAASLGDHEAAREHLERALALEPDSPRIALETASLLARQRNVGDNRVRALDILEDCLDRNAGRETSRGRELARLHFLLASLHDDTPEGYELAIRSYRAGLEWEPDFEAAHNNLGALHLERGEVDEALDHFARALSVRPTYPQACLNFAKALFRHGTHLELERHLATLLRVAGDQAPAALAEIARRLVDLAEHDVYAEVHERDHKIKNLLGLTGNRLRQARTAMGSSPETVELDEAIGVLRQAYDSMRLYLRAIQPQADGERVDLNAVIERVAERLEPSRPEGCRLVVEPSPGLPPIAGNTERLEEAILNLAQNGFEAMQGQGTLILSTALEREQGCASVSVEDDGPGIPEQLRAEVFRTGFTTKPSGNGLGLAIVRRTVTDFHGSLKLHSRPGSRTRFTLTFPLDPDPTARQGGLALTAPMLEDPGSLIVSELA